MSALETQVYAAEKALTPAPALYRDKHVRSRRAIVALSDSEIQDFFPGHLWQELEALLPGCTRVSLPPAQPSDWLQLWKEAPAEILVSAWQTPSLNSDLPAVDLTSLKYVCHLAGTIRKLVPRELIANGLLVTNWGDSIAAN